MRGSMALTPKTIRFDKRAEAYVSQAASELGVSISQFVREAALIRALLVVCEEHEMIPRHEIARWRELSRLVASLATAASDED